MKTLALHEIGEVIRKVRKDRGLRLEDLADQNISPATVSNIERGVAHVSPEKVTYLLEKLQLPEQKLPEILVQEQLEIKKVKFQLLTISSLRQTGHVDDALRELEHLRLDDNHPYIAHAYFNKGKCYLSKKRWRQAERAFYNALRSAQQNPYKENNMESASYLQLGLCRYYQNDYNQALSYIEDGLKNYSPDGELPHIYHLLHRHKGLLLYHLHRIAEGMQLIQEFWPELSKVDDVETILSFYWMRAEFSRRTRLTEEAIEYAFQGIDIARRNQFYSQMLDLWTVLGTIYTEQQEWELAETSFNMARKLEDQVPADDRLITVYHQMGILYLRQKQQEKAKQVIEKAIEYAKKFQNHSELINNLILYGELNLSLQNPAKAIDSYKQAISLAQQNQYIEKEYQTWYHLACCYDGKDEEAFQHCLRQTFKLKQSMHKQAQEHHLETS